MRHAEAVVDRRRKLAWRAHLHFCCGSLLLVPAGDSSCGSSTMPLTLEKLKELQEEALADDCEIDMDRMKSWSESQAQ